jgi:hypothetical protein
MFLSSALARFLFCRLRLSAVIIVVLCGAVLLPAQCPAPEQNPNPVLPRRNQKLPDQEPLLPEAGSLSNTHYTSQFFGFGFDLPLTVQGHEIRLPIMPEKQHMLLALQFEKDGRNGYIMVTAADPRPGFDIDTPERRKQEAELQQWSEGGGFGALSPLKVPAFMLRSGHFYSATHRNGRNYAAQYWAGINNYMVKVMIVTNDTDFLHKAKNLMAGARFYCPLDDGTLTDESGKPVKIEGEPYYGPTVPTYRVNAALRDEPGKKIPAGAVADGTYRNADLGMQYQLPAGWAVVPPDKDDPPPEASSSRSYRFLHACSQILLQIAPQNAAAKDDEPGPEIVLRVLDPNCLSMRTAFSLTDKRTIDEVAASLEQMGEFGAIDSDELMSIHDHLFMIFRGTLPTSTRGEELGRRLSQEIFATRYNKLLLMWSVLAPNSAALADVPSSRILFDGSPAIELRTSLVAAK